MRQMRPRLWRNVSRSAGSARNAETIGSSSTSCWRSASPCLGSRSNQSATRQDIKPGIADANAGYAGDYQVMITNDLASLLSATATLSLTNASPIAGTDGLLVPQGQLASLPISALLANDVDPDGQPLVLSGVSASSHAGAAVTRGASR